MSKKNLFALLAGLSFGGWLLLEKFEIKFDFVRRQGNRTTETRPNSPAPVPTSLPESRARDSIRIATFNIQVFGDTKLSKPHVMEYLANIARRFDVLAIQEICARNQDVLPRYVDHINSVGRSYDYVIGARIGRSTSKEQYAYVFDRETVEVDRNQLYTINDPEDMLHREPFVAWFRVRGPPKTEAFTFTLINIHTDPDETREEVNALDDVFRLVRNDGRNEDDVILLGDLNVGYRRLGQLGQIPDIFCVIEDQATNTRKTKSYDNILFQQRATSEFLGRAEVFDFMREFNLTMQESIEISDHMPVWAEFSVYEGGSGRVATRPGRPTN